MILEDLMLMRRHCNVWDLIQIKLVAEQNIIVYLCYRMRTRTKCIKMQNDDGWHFTSWNIIIESQVPYDLEIPWMHHVLDIFPWCLCSLSQLMK